jgi:hypothetical protein
MYVISTMYEHDCDLWCYLFKKMDAIFCIQIMQCYIFIYEYIYVWKSVINQFPLKSINVTNATILRERREYFQFDL